MKRVLLLLLITLNVQATVQSDFDGKFYSDRPNSSSPSCTVYTKALESGLILLVKVIPHFYKNDDIEKIKNYCANSCKMKKITVMDCYSNGDCFDNAYENRMIVLFNPTETPHQNIILRREDSTNGIALKASPGTFKPEDVQTCSDYSL